MANVSVGEESIVMELSEVESRLKNDTTMTIEASEICCEVKPENKSFRKRKWKQYSSYSTYHPAVKTRSSYTAGYKDFHSQTNGALNSASLFFYRNH